MKRTLAKQLPSYLGQRVELRGHLNNIRSLGKIHFLILKDRSGFAQIVIEDKDQWKKISALQPGSVLRVQGSAEPSSADLGCELHQPQIEVEVAIATPPAIEYYKPTIPSDLEFILDHRPLSLRNREISAIFTLQAAIAHAYRLYMHDEVQATEYFAPCMIGASSEGGAEFFSVDYFGHTATLAQSSQLYKQIMVGSHERVYALMPFFRAESSNTPRHLTEGKQFEFEMGFFEHWHEILDIQEGCIKFIVAYLQKHCQTELEILNHPLIDAPIDVPIPRVTFKEAQEIYFKRSGIDERNEPDLSPAAEKELCRYAKETFGTDLIFILDWYAAKRPFYSYPNPEDPSLTNTFDLLCAGIEITSGGQRCHTLESMIEGIRAKGMDPDDFEDYLSIFKQGMAPHGGFGMGLERLTLTLLQLKNIRQASLFPSDPKRIAGKKLKAHMFFGQENIRNEIIRQMSDHSYEYNHLKHEPTPTSEDSARVRHTRLEEGIKSIIVKGKTSKKNYQLNIPSHLKLNMKAVAALVGEKCEFESPEVIEQRFGLQVGGIPPFGPLLGLETFFDRTIESLTTVAFNCGLKTESLVMKSQDLISLVDPKWGDFTKNESSSIP